jgi:type IX secretion system PorP/SprF family membrane protein
MGWLESQPMQTFHEPQTDFSMKKLLLFSVAFILGTALFGQDEAIFAHYNITPILVNPAAAGFKDQTQVQFNARTQWAGFPDAPTTFGVQYNGPLGKTFGIGGGLLAENAARLTRVRAKLNYAFRFNIQETVKLAVGFSTEFQDIRLGNGILAQTFYQAGDSRIESAVRGTQSFDASFGIFATVKENTYFGLSFTNLVKARLDNIVTDTQGSFFSYYVFLAGHRFDLSDGAISIEPSIMVRQIKNAPFQMDVNMKVGFLNDKLITGLSYRSIKTVGVMLGTEISENLRMFYTFDLSLQDLQRYSVGSHEFSLIFGINKSKKGPRSPYGRR